jgi:hypothetical protein
MVRQQKDEPREECWRLSYDGSTGPETAAGRREAGRSTALAADAALSRH